MVSIKYEKNQSLNMLINNRNGNELFSGPRGVIVNSSETKAYVIDYDIDALFEVDLTNGDRRIFSK
jgi:hypothetical protein